MSHNYPEPPNSFVSDGQGQEYYNTYGHEYINVHNEVNNIQPTHMLQNEFRRQNLPTNRRYLEQRPLTPAAPIRQHQNLPAVPQYLEERPLTPDVPIGHNHFQQNYVQYIHYNVDSVEQNHHGTSHLGIPAQGQEHHGNLPTAPYNYPSIGAGSDPRKILGPMFTPTPAPRPTISPVRSASVPPKTTRANKGRKICRECGKSYSRTNGVTRHMVEQHQDKFARLRLFRCHYCDASKEWGRDDSRKAHEATCMLKQPKGPDGKRIKVVENANIIREQVPEMEFYE